MYKFYKSGIYDIIMNEYSPKTWLALEIFAVTFVLTMSRSSLPVVTNLSIQQLCVNTLVVLDFHVFGGTNFSLMNEGNIFHEFLTSCFQFNSQNSQK